MDNGNEKHLTSLLYPPCWIVGEAERAIGPDTTGVPVKLTTPAMLQLMPGPRGSLMFIAAGLGVPEAPFDGWQLARPATSEEERSYRQFRMSLSGLASPGPS